MIKLKDLLKETTVSMGQVQSNPYASSFKSSEQIEEEKESINEELKRGFMVHSDPDATERDWKLQFKELSKGHPHPIDYGPRESDMYDWNDRNNYNDAIKEYNKYMTKISIKLNAAVKDMNNIWKTWTKIRDKYRKKDKKEKF